MRLARHLTIVLTVLTLSTTPLIASDLGHRAPAKPMVHHQSPAPDPEVLRQGGDTIADAVPLVLPVYELAGTTAGYTDDYEESCPFGSTSPDVVYSFSIPTFAFLDFDLCGSQYDTKIFIYDEQLDLVACNDDFYYDDICGQYVSKIENAEILGGVTYYVVIDGYGGSSGEYLLTIPTPDPPCILELDPSMVDEAEPELVDGYEDAYNGGCNSPQFGYPFVELASSDILFGTSGWYLYGGSEYRDTDWFTHEIGSAGYREIFIEAEYETRLYELEPTDCSTVEVVQELTVQPCVLESIIVTGEPGTTVWLWVGPTTYTGPWPEYDYILHLEPMDPVATEPHSWTAVKGLFD
jgi:hypothetical protein